MENFRNRLTVSRDNYRNLERLCVVEINLHDPTSVMKFFNDVVYSLKTIIQFFIELIRANGNQELISIMRYIKSKWDNSKSTEWKVSIEEGKFEVVKEIQSDIREMYNLFMLAYHVMKI
jgi:hypothetical protein